MKTAEAKTTTESSHSWNPGVQNEPFFTSAEGERSSFFGPVTIQPKLKIGAPDDKYEKQADRVADRVVQMPDSGPGVQMQEMEEEEMLQTQPMEEEEPIQMQEEEEMQAKLETNLQTKCEACAEEESLQMKEINSSNPTDQIGPRLDSKKGSGSHMSNSVQNELSNKMGADFSNVNIHTGPEAIQMNRSLGARAFTHGNDIYFNQGEYNPSTPKGKHLLAHELTHVLQQSGANRSRLVQRQGPVTESDSESDGQQPQVDRSWLYERIGFRLNLAFTKFATACERHRNSLREAAANNAEVATVMLEVLLTMVSPGLGRLLQNAISGAVAVEASEAVYRVALEAMDRSDEIISAAGTIAKHNAKSGFQAVLSRNPEEHYVDEIFQSMSVAMDTLHNNLQEKSDEELSVIYANYDPSIATLDHYVAEIGRLISLYRSQVMPIGQPTGGAYGTMKARWIEGSTWRALALTGEGRYYNADQRPHLITWISSEMRSLAEDATESATGQSSISSVHYRDLNLTNSDAERAFAMLDSRQNFLSGCGMVIERSSGVSPRRGAACPGCHGDTADTLPPESSFNNLDIYDQRAWNLFREGQQNLTDTERDQLIEWIRQVEQE
jgi:hypothetical protein